MGFVFATVNNCGKRRKRCLPPFSPFSEMFSKAYFLRDSQTDDCMVAFTVKVRIYRICHGLTVEIKFY